MIIVEADAAGAGVSFTRPRLLLAFDWYRASGAHFLAYIYPGLHNLAAAVARCCF